jgi:hypothetical protein
VVSFRDAARRSSSLSMSNTSDFSSTSADEDSRVLPLGEQPYLVAHIETPTGLRQPKNALNAELPRVR